MKNIVVTEEELNTGRQIQPYKLAVLMRIAAQVIDKLCSIPQFVANYDDIEFVLETVMSAVKRARRSEENGR